MTHTYNLSQSEFDLLIAHYLHSLLTAKDVKCNGSMSVNDFRNQNRRVLLAATSECNNEFSHEATYEQVGMAIKIYFMSRR